MIRRVRKRDLIQIRALHERAGAKFDLPEKMEAAYVMEDAGRIVALAAGERCSHIFMIIDPAWGSPHQKLELIESFHWPVAKALYEKGCQYVFAFIDPRFVTFGKRLEPLGWIKRVWECWSLSQTEVAKRLGKAT